MAPAGLVVVDTGRHAEHTDRLLAFARTLERPVIAVVNTPWHLDHIGGNACLRDAFAALCVPTSGAFEGARAGGLARHRSELETAIASGDVAAGDFEAMCAELALLDAASALASDSIVTTAAASARPERRSDPG